MSDPIIKGTLLADALAGYPREVQMSPNSVRKATATGGKFLVVIDDDPTGSQSVSNIPVITKWAVADFDWAFRQNQGAVFVLLNSRALDAAAAQELNSQTVQNALESASKINLDIAFISRSDSTLRGHFPKETDSISHAWQQAGKPEFKATLMIPAFPGAGRVTIGGVHYLLSGEDLIPVGETEFARDVSFGFSSSRISEYVEEKTGGAISSKDVQSLDLNIIRSGSEAIATALLNWPDDSIVAVDAASDNDLRLVAAGVALAQEKGAQFLFRTGPAFVAAWIGQAEYAPIASSQLLSQDSEKLPGGLIVIGSHVALTNRQLEQVKTAFPEIVEIELTTEMARDPNFADEALPDIVILLANSLKKENAILRTSRDLVVGSTPEESLAISRLVSANLALIVNQVLKENALSFVIAKGGITSNDVASIGLEVRHAIAVGPLLPGVISLWRPIDGVAVGMPFVVFPGNVGSDEALMEIVQKLSTPKTEMSST